MISTNNKLYLLPSKEKNINVITKKKKEILPYPIEWKLQYMNVWIENIFSGYVKDDDKLILYPCLGNMLLKIDLNKGDILGEKIYEEDNIYRRKEIIKHIKSTDITDKIIGESYADVRLLLDVIIENEKEKKCKKHIKEKNIQIWNAVKGS